LLALNAVEYPRLKAQFLLIGKTVSGPGSQKAIPLVILFKGQKIKGEWLASLPPGSIS